MKKCFYLVLIVLMLLASVNVSATEVSSIDIMTNGNFEGDSSGWDSGGKVGYGLSRDYSRSPLYSYKVTYDPDVVNTNQALTVRYFDAIPGATYEFSAWAYIASTLPSDSKPGFSATFMGENNTTVGKGFSYQYKDIVPGQWCEGTNSAVAPEGATKVRIMLRLYNNSNTTENAVCYFDDTSFIVSGSGDIITSYIQDMEYQRQLAKESQDSYDAQLAKINATEFEDGAENLIPNPDFENGSDYTPANWGSYANGVWGTSLIRTNETAYSGSYSVKIDTTADGNQKGVAQTIFSGFEPGRKYLFQSKVKVKSYTRGDGASLKILPLASTSGGLYNYLDGANSGNFIWEYEDPDGEYWHDLKCVVDLPEETACVVVYLVVQGSCEIYFDDVKFGLAKGENYFTFFPERTFFYLDNEFGSVFADFN